MVNHASFQVAGLSQWERGLPCDSAGKESACNTGDLCSIPGLGISPGEWKGYPLQYAGLENSMDCEVQGVTKSQTGLSNLHFHFYTLTKLCYTEALEWSSLVPGSKAKSSLEITNPTSFTVSYHLLANLLQWCPTLCGPMDYSLPGPSVHGIFQARILEWTAGLSSRGSSQWRDWTRIS